MTPDPEPPFYLWGADVDLLNKRLEAIAGVIREDHGIKEFGPIAEVMLLNWRPT